ncbi:MAG: retention module-containing protein, partial [Pseudomonadota bacterium]
MASIKIGAVENLHGQVSVIHADGSTEVLQPGNAVYADDTVITAEDGTASIRFLDGSTYILGPDFTAILNSDIFDPAGFSQPATVDDMAQLNDSALLPGIEQPTVLSSAITDTDEILQDILEGEDPTETAEAPAAGEEVQEDSGNTFIRIAESGRAVTPDSGYETTGIGYGFTDVREELLQTPTNRAP